MRLERKKALPCALTLAVALAIAGCASGPDYHTPALPETASGSFVSQSPQVDAGSPPPADWWKLYDDPALDAIVQEALSANTDLRVALANLDRARAVYRETRGKLLPSTNVTAGASRGRNQTSWSGAGQAPVQWNYTGGLDISYELDFFGRVRRDIEAARGDTEAVAAAHDAALVLVAAETTRSYVDACAYGESVDVAHSSVELAQKTLDLVTRQERAGSASRLDVERSGAALAQAEAAVPRLQAQQNAALFGLAALMGRAPSQVPEPARACNKAPQVAGAIPVGDGATMLRRRPDIRQAERQLAADTARVGVAVADLYPRIALGASASYLRNDYLRGDRAWSFGFGPLISWTFPNMTAARSRIAQAKAQGAASLARFDGAVLTALKESEQTLSTYAGAMQQRDALVQAQTHAESAFRLAEQRYRAGSISYLDVLVAQNSLISARAQVATADQQAGSARVDVFKALGGGWQARSQD
ncbi:MAG: efflux transporter outer membrane subunit [Rhodocyclaceae bacterium]|nr:efflux transporter outer membrane subunit [Rhodocyclaceae bacterium]MCP5308815.1 efflux transporter outer membrane subunit [Zoogloeaceae bacterium]